MTTFAGVPTSAAAKLPQQQALVIALDDFGQRTATSAHGHIVDLALGLGLPSPRSLPIGWLAAERSGGEWQGASLDAPGPSAPLSGLIGQTLAAYPMQDRYAVFLAAKVETPADVDALISAAQVWRDYAALHRDIAGTAQVFGFCYVPSRRDSADPAVLTARSQALHRLAEAIEGQWSPCRHVLLFEDGALAEGGDEPFAERLGHLLALLLTNRPLADYYAGLPEQIALWQHRQFFSSFSAAALALPAAALAHRAGLDLTTRYLNGWLLTAERTTEGEQAFEAAQGQRDRLLAVARWEEEIRQHCAAEFSLFDGTPHVSGGSHDPWEAKPRFLDMPRIYSNLPPDQIRRVLAPSNDPTTWRAALDEAASVVAELMDGAPSHPERSWSGRIAEAAAGRPGWPDEGLAARTESELRELLNGLVCRAEGPPAPFHTVRQMIRQVRAQVQLSTQVLARQRWAAVNLDTRRRDLDGAAAALPLYWTVIARYAVGAALALALALAGLLVGALPACAPTPDGSWLPRMADGSLCLPPRDAIQMVLLLAAALTGLATWPGLRAWHNHMAAKAVAAWDAYWNDLQLHFGGVLYRRITEEQLRLLRRLETGPLEELDAAATLLETELLAVLAANPVPDIAQALQSSGTVLNLANEQLAAALLDELMEATGWDPTLRSLARGSDLFSGPAGGGLASGAMTVWNRLHRGDNVRAIQTELLSLQAAQVLQDHRFAILRDLLPGHPETQRDLPRLLEALNKRAIPLVTLQDADESPFRLGSRQGQLFVADPDRTAGLRDVLPGVRTEDSADTHRITLALTVEPFSLRALSSVLRLEDLTGQA